MPHCPSKLGVGRCLGLGPGLLLPPVSLLPWAHRMLLLLHALQLVFPGLTAASTISASPMHPLHRFEAAAEAMALRSRLGGEARLQQAICLDSMGRNPEVISWLPAGMFVRGTGGKKAGLLLLRLLLLHASRPWPSAPFHLAAPPCRPMRSMFESRITQPQG